MGTHLQASAMSFNQNTDFFNGLIHLPKSVLMTVDENAEEIIKKKLRKMPTVFMMKTE